MEPELNVGDSIIIVNHRHEGKRGKVLSLLAGRVEVLMNHALPVHIKYDETYFNMAFPSHCVKKEV